MLSPADRKGRLLCAKVTCRYTRGQDALALHQADRCRCAQIVDSEDSCNAAEQSTAL